MDGTEIGRVTAVHFHREDHGILTCHVDIRFKSGAQSYGGYAMDKTDHHGGREPLPHAGAVLLRVVEFFGGSIGKAPDTVVEAIRVLGVNGPIDHIKRLDIDGGAVLDFAAIAAAYVRGAA